MPHTHARADKPALRSVWLERALHITSWSMPTLPAACPDKKKMVCARLVPFVFSQFSLNKVLELQNPDDLTEDLL
jgi:hypothetical protein